MLHGRMGLGFGRMGVASLDAAASFDPLTAFAGENFVLYDPRVVDSLFQDTGEVSPALLHGEAVRLWKDQSGNDYHITGAADANRPLLNIDGAVRSLNWDGSTDRLFNNTTNIRAIIRNKPFATMMATVLPTTSATNLTIAGFSVAANASTNKFALFKSSADKATISTKRIDIDTAATKPSTASVNGAWHVLTAESDPTTQTQHITVDGGVRESVSNIVSAGSFEDVNSNVFQVGALNVGNFYSGLMGPLFAIGRALGVGEKFSMQTWMANGYLSI